MFANERQNKILEMLKSSGAITTSGLVDKFKVSIETVRRDLLHMEKMGYLSRVHGGAVEKSSMKPFLNLKDRNEEYSSQKRELSQNAVDFVSDGDIIAIDSGSTAIHFAKCIKANFTKLTVVTHSLDVFSILNDCDDFSVILCGGHFLKNENAFYGHFTLNMLENLHIQKAFVCPSAVSLEWGIADYQKDLFDVQKALIRSSDLVYILADSSKFEKKALLKLDDMRNDYYYITDSNLNYDMKKLYDESNISIYTGKGDTQNDKTSG